MRVVPGPVKVFDCYNRPVASLVVLADDDVAATFFVAEVIS